MHRCWEYTTINPLSAHADGLRLSVHLTPNAAREHLDRIDQSAGGNARLRVTVTAVPEKGKTNRALVKFLAKKLRLPKSAIQIIAGHHARDKTLLITGDTPSLTAHVTDTLVEKKLMTL